LDGKGKTMYRYGLLLAAAGLLLCAAAVLAQDADTVDGFDAYSTPHANALLALDGSARFPGDAIANDSIPGSRLVPGAVTAGRLGNNSVTTDKITDGQVMEADLAAGAVTSSKIANDSVSHVKITNGTILGEDIDIPLSMSGSSSSGGIIRATNTANSFLKYTAKGLYGEATGTGTTYGVYGKSTSTSGRGAMGYADASTGGTIGVYGYASSNAGTGVYGYCASTSGTTYGIKGYARSDDGYGCYAENYNGNYGHMGSGNYGVYGYNAANGNRAYLAGGYGVYGKSNTTSAAVYASNTVNDTTAKAVYGYGFYGYGGYFVGDLYASGTFSCADKHFKIDHPLDPANMYLEHACVESSERLDVYSGTIILDGSGQAWVQLPDWFEALNCDFRYQLTPIGAPGPNLYIAQEIANGCFRIAGGVPGTKVSWQVTGVRQDPYALAHPMQVEVEKPEAERGYYMHPELYGQPETMSIEWATDPEGMAEIQQDR
jgi:hypothetical protein